MKASNENSLTFEEAVKNYVDMALDIWPSLNLCIENVPEAIRPPEGSTLPEINFSELNQRQFRQAISAGLCDLIYNHDVQSNDIEDYLVDVLYILNSEEQNTKTIRYTSTELGQLIKEAQDKDFSRLEKFQELYHRVKQTNIQHQFQEVGSDSDSSEDGEYSGDESEYSEGSEEEEEEEEEMEGDEDEEAPELQEYQNQQTQKITQKETKKENEQENEEAEQKAEKKNIQNEEEDDDGWIIVKKKKRR